MKRLHSEEDVVAKKQKEECLDGFSLALIKFNVGIEPVNINNVHTAVHRHLSKWIGKYQYKLNGYCLAFFDGKATSHLGGILGDCPSIYMPCQAKFLMFYPKLKTKIQIKVVSSSPHHIGGLMLGFIHVSIPKLYIPDEFEFKYDNSISGKWTTKQDDVVYAIGDIINCTIIGKKQDGHEMTLFGTISTKQEQILAYIKSFSPNSVTFDQLAGSDNESSSSDDSNSDSSSNSSDSDTSDDGSSSSDSKE